MGSVFQEIRRRASQLSRRIVFTGTEDSRILRAAVEAKEEGVAHSILVGDPEHLLERARRTGTSLFGIKIHAIDQDSVNLHASSRPPEWRARGIGEIEARERLWNPVEFSAAMMRQGEADGMLVGSGLMPEQGRGTRRNATPFRYFLAEISNGGEEQCRIFASPLSLSRTSAIDLAETALEAARQYSRLAERAPFLAYLSLGATARLRGPDRFRTAQEGLEECVHEAIRSVRARDNALNISGQFYDEIPQEAESLPNVFVFASERGNSLRELLRALPEETRVLGPLLGGGDGPLNAVSSTDGVEDVIDITAITCLS